MNFSKSTLYDEDSCSKLRFTALSPTVVGATAFRNDDNSIQHCPVPPPSNRVPLIVPVPAKSNIQQPQRRLPLRMVMSNVVRRQNIDTTEKENQYTSLENLFLKPGKRSIQELVHPADLRCRKKSRQQLFPGVRQINTTYTNQIRSNQLADAIPSILEKSSPPLHTRHTIEGGSSGLSTVESHNPVAAPSVRPCFEYTYGKEVANRPALNYMNTVSKSNHINDNVSRPELCEKSQENKAQYLNTSDNLQHLSFTECGDAPLPKENECTEPFASSEFLKTRYSSEHCFLRPLKAVVQEGSRSSIENTAFSVPLQDQQQETHQPHRAQPFMYQRNTSPTDEDSKCAAIPGASAVIGSCYQSSSTMHQSQSRKLASETWKNHKTLMESPSASSSSTFSEGFDSECIGSPTSSDISTIWKPSVSFEDVYPTNKQRKWTPHITKQDGYLVAEAEE